MLLARFESTNKRLSIDSLDSAATGIGSHLWSVSKCASWLTGVSTAWESKGIGQGEDFRPAQGNLEVAIW